MGLFKSGIPQVSSAILRVEGGRIPRMKQRHPNIKAKPLNSSCDGY